MKKLLFLLLLFPLNVFAVEASLGISYGFRKFDKDDELGSVTAKKALTPNLSNTFNIHTSFLWGDKIKYGPFLGAGYGSLRVEEVGTHYLNKKTIETPNIPFQSFLTGVQIQTNNFFFVPAFYVHSITYGLSSDIADADSGFSFFFGYSKNLFTNQKLFVMAQLFLTPSIERNYDVIPSYGFSIGIENLFEEKKLVQKVEDSVILSEETTPVTLSQQATKIEEPVVSLPQPATKTDGAETEQKQPSTLKFNENTLDGGSNGFLDKLLKVHKTFSSVIRIYHSQDKNSKAKAESLVAWFVEKGIEKQDIIVVGNLKTKGIKIEIFKK